MCCVRECVCDCVSVSECAACVSVSECAACVSVCTCVSVRACV